MLVRVLHALALVRLRRVEAAQFGGDLADELFVGTFDGDLGVLLDDDFDLVGDVVLDGVRIAEVHRHDLAGYGGFEADAADLEPLAEAVDHALDHVVDERARQAVQRPGVRILALAGHQHSGALDLGGRAWGQIEIQLAPGTFDRNFAAADLDLHLRRDDDGLFANAGHGVRVESLKG